MRARKKSISLSFLTVYVLMHMNITSSTLDSPAWIKSCSSHGADRPRDQPSKKRMCSQMSAPHDLEFNYGCSGPGNVEHLSELEKTEQEMPQRPCITASNARPGISHRPEGTQQSLEHHGVPERPVSNLKQDHFRESEEPVRTRRAARSCHVEFSHYLHKRSIFLLDWLV